MTNNTLPEEVLLMIFDHANDNDKNDANIYQHVCRAWYQPAHITFLQNVNLDNYAQVEQFIRSIDCNPKPLYLKVVKKITISSVDYTLGNTYLVTLFSQAMIKKLFFRFPNLERVLLHGSFKIFRNFSDELCQEFLYHCPKLVSFDIGYSSLSNEYSEAIQRACLLVTELDMGSLDGAVCTTSIITCLPRLNSIRGDFSLLDSFGKFLSIVEMTPSLRRIKLKSNSKDVVHFAENYLSWKPKEEQDQIVKRLSKIKSLNWNTGWFNSSTLNSLKFIAKYLTGLDQLELLVELQEPWVDRQQKVFCSMALDLIRSKRNANLDLHVYDDYSYRYLAFALTQMRIQVLQLSLAYHDQPGTTMRIESDRPQFMNILNSFEPSPYLFSAATPLTSINEFILKISYRNRNIISYVDDYPRMFQGMPSLKKATLDVPAKLPEKRERRRSSYTKPEGFTLEEIPSSYMDQNPLCAELHSLTIRATPFGEIQSLLKRCPYMFPNLNNLDIHYYCGVWDESIGNFQLGLGRYSLEKLAVDVTPVKMILKKEFSKDQFTKNYFFVVALEMLNGEERHLFKVSLDLSSVTRINGNELKGFIRSIDYLCVSIIISSLKQLELVTYRYGTPEEEDEYYLNVGRRTTNIVL